MRKVFTNKVIMTLPLSPHQLDDIILQAQDKKLFTWLPGSMDIQQIVLKIISTLHSADQAYKPTRNYDILVKIAPTSYGLWFTNQQDLLELGRIIVGVIFNDDATLPAPLIFHIYNNPGISEEEIIFSTIEEVPATDDTTYLLRDKIPNDPDMQEESAPYLIDHRKNVVPIKKTVFNIGRLTDNDLVIDDPRISRQHAQIRLTSKGCILFDLDSTGGTFINNQRIKERQLVPGDIVSIAGISLIYNEEKNLERIRIDETAGQSQTRPPQGPDGDQMEFIG